MSDFNVEFRSFMNSTKIFIFLLLLNKAILKSDNRKESQMQSDLVVY